jgi:ABC-type oligopeptide transport system substrate-binding subunit
VRIITKLSVCFALFFILTFRAFGYQSLSVNNRENKRMIVVGISNFPVSLDPVTAFSFQHFLVVQCAYQTLTRISESGDLVSDLARSWQISRDGRTYTFDLNEDIHFHNGDRLTADDVAYSLSRHIWPESKSVVANYLRETILGAAETKSPHLPVGIKVLSANRIEIKLISAYPPFLSILAMPSFGIVAQKPFRAGHIIGSGPYAPAAGNSSTRILFKRYGGYKGGYPQLDQIEVRHWQSAAELASLLRNEDIDVAFGVPIPDLHQIAEYSNYRVTKSNSVVFNHLFFNERSPLLKQRDFRRDLAGLVYSVAESSKPTSEVFKFSPYYVPRGLMPDGYYKRKVPEFSPEKFKAKWATQLSSTALKFAFNSTYFDKDFCFNLERALAGVSIKGVFATRPPQDFRGMADGGDYDVLGGVYVANFADPDGILAPISPGTGMRYGTADTRGLFEQIGAAKHEPDKSLRLQKYSDILLAFESEWHLIPLYQVNLPIVHHNKIAVPDTNFRYEAELFNFIWSHKSGNTK